MNNLGQNGEKTGYRVILLLVVALAAFSSAMKELNQFHQWTSDTSRLIASWSEMFAPAVPSEIPAPVKIETCENSKTLLPPKVELPRDDDDAQGETREKESDRPLVRDHTKDSKVVTLKKVQRTDLDSGHVTVMILGDDDLDTKAIDAAITSHLPLSMLKAKSRKQITIGPAGRGLVLKTLNRGINLRIAG